MRGASLIDTIVGIALMLLIFMGVYAAFQLSIDLVSNNKARIGATALAQEQMEYIRSLPYESMAVVGGIPAGSIPQTETVALNGVNYTRRTLIRYFDDPKDGLGGVDTNGNIADSKEIKVETSWTNLKTGTRTIALVSRASPVGVEQSVPGGTIAIAVVNADSQPVPSAQVRIVNASTSPAVDITSYTDVDGTTVFIGAPAASGYQIAVSKSGYNSAQTYPASGQNPNPNPGNLTVSNNQTTSATFSIDLVAQKTVRTYKAIETLTWEDLFSDSSKTATTTNVTISGGDAHLTGPVPYPASGEVQSNDLAPTYLYTWKTARWTDTKPASTSVAYSVYYLSAGSPTLIPDAALPGNSTGFTASPLNLSGISTTTYPSIRLRAVLSTTDTSATPSVDSWDIVYDRGPEPLGNIQFTMSGNKMIGSDGSGNPIYKYDQTSASDVGGSVMFSSLENDTYTITVNGTGIGYDIAESCQPQPRALAPNSNMTTLLYFTPHTANSLLVDVRDAGGAMIPDATIRVYKTGYDTTKTSSSCGQAFFSGLSADTYSIDVSASGYAPQTITNVNVSGASRSSAILN